jgi:glutaredoxin-related protein
MLGDYNKIETEGCFSVSPSSLHAWFENPYIWHKSNILKERNFTANTNTVFGTLCHAVAEYHHRVDVLSKDEINNYLSSFKNNPSVDEWYIMDNFKDAESAIIKHLSFQPKRDEVEYPNIFSPVEGYAIGGTIDYRYGSTMGDYKTCSSLPSKIKTKDMFQLVAYAIAEINSGKKIDHIEVTYIARPDVKGKPSEKSFNKDGSPKIIGIKNTQIKTIREPITDEVMVRVKSSLKLLIKTLKTLNTYPELADVLFRPNELSFMND